MRLLQRSLWWWQSFFSSPHWEQLKVSWEGNRPQSLKLWLRQFRHILIIIKNNYLTSWDIHHLLILLDFILCLLIQLIKDKASYYGTFTNQNINPVKSVSTCLHPMQWPSVTVHMHSSMFYTRIKLLFSDIRYGRKVLISYLMQHIIVTKCPSLTKTLFHLLASSLSTFFFTNLCCVLLIH